MKQMRLPFAPINKKAASSGTPPAPSTPGVAAKKEQDSNAGSGAKRKRSQEGDCTPSKVVLREGGSSAAEACSSPSVGTKENASEDKRTPRRIQTVFLGKSSEKPRRNSSSSDSQGGQPAAAAPKEAKAKKRLPLLPADDKESEAKEKPSSPKVQKEAASPKTPKSAPKPPSVSTCSPLVMEEKKFKLKVAVAKVSVAINEMNDSMEKAADAKDFLKAAEVKEQLDKKKKEKQDLEEVLHSDDGAKMDEVIRGLTDSAKKASAQRRGSSAAEGQGSANSSPASDARKRTATVMKTPGSQSSGGTPDSSKKPRKMTPKQEQRKAELQKKKEEKDKQKEEARLERERQKEASKLEKERKKEEERQKKEEERRRKEEEKLEKEREKERAKKEKEEQKEAEKLEKEKEKKRKEEEKEEREKEKKLKAEAKIAEQQRKQEEKERQLQQEKEKSQKEAASFKSFFIKKCPTEKAEATACVEEAKTIKHFNQFRIKKDMRIAPAIRKIMKDSDITALEKSLEPDSPVSAEFKLYLKVLQAGNYNPGKSSKTWPLEDVKRENGDDDDVEIIEDDEEEGLLGEESSSKIIMAAEGDETEEKKQGMRVRAKLLQFCENQRPAYWGTWTKKTTCVTGRRPFARDESHFDYEYDSDDDWEEEEQGESLSDEEKDKEEDEGEQEDDDDDDGFFVGHGVLDKDEINKEDEDEEDGGVIEYDEELEQKKQRMRAQEFEEQYKKKKPTKLKPRVFGCMWVGEEKDDKMSEMVCEQLLKILKPFTAVNLLGGDDTILGSPIPTLLSSPKPSPGDDSILAGTPGRRASSAKSSDAKTGSASTKVKKVAAVFPEDAMKDLIRLVHVNTSNKIFMVKEFVAFLSKRNAVEETSAEVPPNPTGTPKSVVENK